MRLRRASKDIIIFPLDGLRSKSNIKTLGLLIKLVVESFDDMYRFMSSMFLYKIKRISLSKARWIFVIYPGYR